MGGMIAQYTADSPAREDLDQSTGPILLDFGTNWCGHCRAARPLIEAALAERPDIRHVAVEDGKGRPLGRSFGVKLWPTLVLLRDGREVHRLVRPQTIDEIRDALSAP
jgi:thioredoxin 1